MVISENAKAKESGGEIQSVRHIGKASQIAV